MRNLSEPSTFPESAQMILKTIQVNIENFCLGSWKICLNLFFLCLFDLTTMAEENDNLILSWILLDFLLIWQKVLFHNSILCERKEGEIVLCKCTFSLRLFLFRLLFKFLPRKETFEGLWKICTFTTYIHTKPLFLHLIKMEGGFLQLSFPSSGSYFYCLQSRARRRRELLIADKRLWNEEFFCCTECVRLIFQKLRVL